MWIRLLRRIRDCMGVNLRLKVGSGLSEVGLIEHPLQVTFKLFSGHPKRIELRA